MSDWDAHAAGWDDDPGARAYAAAAFVSLEAVLRDRGSTVSGARVMDFGCGTGLLTERLVPLGASVVAVDTSKAMLDVLDAKIAEHSWTEVKTSTELPIVPASFELIVCSSVCAFLDDYHATTRALFELLAPGGVFVQWDWERGDDEPHGLSRGEISDALHAAGLEQISVDIGFEITFEEQVMRPLIGHGRRPTG
jgi:2-polyprenyl-3-methyl-5-hydroxy-6-metoxy-1,4-benzoquinol methylase